MRYLRGFYFSLWAFLVCGSTQAAPIPTLTATAGRADWLISNANISGSDFSLVSESLASNLTYSCSTPVPSGGCVVPGPPLSIQGGPAHAPASGTVTVGGTMYRVTYQGNAQIQYLTSTIVYPDPMPSSTVQIPAVLLGSEMACLTPPNPSATDPCSDVLGTPGYPNFVANISINLAGTLTLYTTGAPTPVPQLEASFTSTPVPEPGSVVLACLGLLALAAASAKIRDKKRNTT